MILTTEDLLKIDEIGEKIALSLRDYFDDIDNRNLIEKLKNSGLKFHTDINQIKSQSLSNLKFVITGTFHELSREKLKLWRFNFIIIIKKYKFPYKRRKCWSIKDFKS